MVISWVVSSSWLLLLVDVVLCFVMEVDALPYLHKTVNSYFFKPSGTKSNSYAFGRLTYDILLS